MTQPDSGTRHLRSFVDRIERLNEEIAGLNADKSEIFKEARGLGFDVPAMREVIRLRKLDDSTRIERSELVDLYMCAYESGTSIATRVRVHEANLNPELGAGDEGKGYAGRDEPAESMPEPNLGGAHPVADGPVATEPTVVAEADKAPEGERPSPIDDPLAIPAFLDRRGRNGRL